MIGIIQTEIEPMQLGLIATSKVHTVAKTKLLSFLNTFESTFWITAIPWEEKFRQNTTFFIL
jgi:hypothetical protein